MSDAQDPKDQEGGAAPTTGAPAQADEPAAAPPIERPLGVIEPAPAALEPAPEVLEPAPAILESPAADASVPETSRSEAPPLPSTRGDASLLLRGLVALAAVGTSLGGFAVELRLGTKLDTFINKNELADRRVLTLAMLGGGALFALVALGWIAIGFLRQDVPRRIVRVHETALFLLPLAIAVFLPLLFRWSAWTAFPLELVLMTSAVGLAFEPMLRVSFARVPERLTRLGEWMRDRTPERVARWTPLVVVVCAAIGYSVFASVFTILHHRRLGTACFDLGQYDNMFYNAMIGHPFKVPSLSGEGDWQSLRSHAELSIYFLLPFYMIKPGPETLLVIQSLLLGSGAIPIYLFGTKFVSRWTAMLVALAYVFYAPLHRSNFYDFHMQPVAAIFVLWTIYFIASNRNVPLWIVFTIALCAREDISVGLAVVGTFLMLVGFRVRVGLVMTLVSLAYFVTMKFVIMPRFGSWWFADIYKDLQIPGSKGYGSIVETLISNPAYVFKTLLTKEKLGYAIVLLMPVAFLPLRRLYLAMAVLPGFAFTLLTTGYNPTVSINFQYNAYWFPYVFPAAIIALRVLGGESALPGPTMPRPEGLVRRRAALGAVLFFSAVSSYHFGALIQRNNFKGGFSKIEFKMTPAERERHANLRELAATIPRKASVAATEHLAPHVSTRSSLYCFRNSIGIAEYVLVGHVDKSAKVTKTLKELMASGKLGVVAEKGGFILLRRGADTTRNAEFQNRL